MLSRRHVLALAPAAILRAAKLTARQRVDMALRGQTPDRTPFSYWFHFGLEKEGPVKHAAATLDFHRTYRTDLVKVMSDFPYPKSESGAWYQLRELKSPFAPQLKALEMIRDGLAGQAHFIETLFNPWNVAEKLSSKEAVVRLMKEKPQALLDALDAIARSEANHARAAIAAGASGIFLAIANAQDGILTQNEYARFSEPFDRIVLDAVASAPLNTLHLHGDTVYLDRFVRDWPAAAISYSAHGTGVSVAQMRKRFSGLLIAGLDERNYRTLTTDQLKAQWKEAQAAAGAKLVLAPGCSVPNNTAPEELERLTRVLGA
jgi:uroporphyrinogen decarboxylase